MAVQRGNAASVQLCLLSSLLFINFIYFLLVSVLRVALSVVFSFRYVFLFIYAIFPLHLSAIILLFINFI